MGGTAQLPPCMTTQGSQASPTPPTRDDSKILLYTYVICTVARARYPLGPRWGFTVLPQVGRPPPAVMPEVGAGPAVVMPQVGTAAGPNRQDRALDRVSPSLM